MSIIKKKQKLQITNAGECVKKRKPSYVVDRNVNWCSYYGEQYGGSSKKLKTELPYDPAILFLSIIAKQNYSLKRSMHPDVHSSTIHNSLDTETA